MVCAIALCFVIFTVSLVIEQNCMYVNWSQFFLVVAGRLHFSVVLYNSAFLSSRISRLCGAFLLSASGEQGSVSEEFHCSQGLRCCFHL